MLRISLKTLRSETKVARLFYLFGSQNHLYIRIEHFLIFIALQLIWFIFLNKSFSFSNESFIDIYIYNI